MLLSHLEEGCWPFFVKIWIPSTQEFGWKPPSSFKERILKYFQYNFTIWLLSPLCIDEISPVFLEKNIFKYFKYNFLIFIFLLLSPCGERCGFLFEQTWIPYIQGCLVPSLVKIGPVVLVKFLNNIFNII